MRIGGESFQLGAPLPAAAPLGARRAIARIRTTAGALSQQSGQQFTDEYNHVRKRRNRAPRYVSLCFKLVAAVFKAVVSRLLVGNRPLAMIYRSVFESRLSQIGLAQN